MIITALFMSTMAASLALLNSYTPLALGLWILTLSLCSAILMSATTFSWFGFMLFLIYIGGMLVMFAYFLAIQPNQQLNLLPSGVTTLLTFSLTPVVTHTPHFLHSHTAEHCWTTALLNIHNVPCLTILALTLFLALLMVVKITSRLGGPLRPFIYV